MGSGLGMFAFSAICGFLIDLYDWKNAVFILGGIVLQGCVFGMLMRPLNNSITKPIREGEGQGLLEADNAAQSGRKCGEESGFESANSSQKGSKDGVNALADDVLINSRRILEQGINPKTPPYMVKLKTDIANEYINSMNSLHNMAISLHHVDQKQDGAKTQTTNSMTSRSQSKNTCMGCVSYVVDVTLLKEPIFYIICVANIFAFLGAFIPLKFQVDRAMTFDLSSSEARTQEMATFLVSVSGTCGFLFFF
jgi:hypothetical protein